MGTGRGGRESRRRLRWSIVSSLIVASLVLVAPPTDDAAAVSDYVSLPTSARLVDTRPGSSTTDGQYAGIGQRPADSTLVVQVAGRAGVPLDASMAVLTVAAVDPLDSAYLTVHPTGTTRPNASNVNYTAFDNTANTVLAELGAGGNVSIYTFGATQLVVDVSGYFPAGSDADVRTASRLVDTREGSATIDGQYAGIGQRPADSTLVVQVAGRAGIPADAATAVLVIAAVDPVASAYLTVHPTGTARPNASNVNYTASNDTANTVLAKLGTDGTVSIYTFGATDLIVDAAGHLPATVYTPLPNPQRLADTRPGASTADGQQVGRGIVPGDSSLQVHVAGRAGIPADASTAVLTVAAVAPQESAFLTVHPTGTDRPNASNVNYTAGNDRANTVLARLGAGGDVCIYTYGETHLIVDVAGYITGPPPPAAGPTCPLPGTPLEAFTAGATAGVAGISVGDTFVLRTLPGELQPVAISLPPLTPLVLTGRGQRLPEFEIWFEVTAPDSTAGWIRMWDLVYPAPLVDATAGALAALGSAPRAATAVEVGDVVVRAIAPSHPDAPPAEIVLARVHVSGTVAETVYDVFPGEFFGDDTTFASRYHVRSKLVSSNPPQYEFDHVLVQTLCSRGVDQSTGFCV